jgi:hypothetical protein
VQGDFFLVHIFHILFKLFKNFGVVVFVLLHHASSSFFGRLEVQPEERVRGRVERKETGGKKRSRTEAARQKKLNSFATRVLKFLCPNKKKSGILVGVDVFFFQGGRIHFPLLGSLCKGRGLGGLHFVHSTLLFSLIRILECGEGLQKKKELGF